MGKRYLDMGDRIELAKAAMEFADKYQLKPVQLYHAMVEAVTEEPEKEGKEDE
ncbi:MAG: hypothetical protein ABSF52_09375 [Syntrophobacteraceae bacterium]|jgi:hypothetical protein